MTDQPQTNAARVKELNALAGFEKSGHFFFNAPVGRGYDDGLVTAIAIVDMLERNYSFVIEDLEDEGPKPAEDERLHARQLALAGSTRQLRVA